MHAATTYDTINSLSLWQRMASITLEEMRGVKLMNRVDTKYVLTEDEVMAMLERAAERGYRVQVIGDVRAARYDTLYYDTAQRDMYVAHHNPTLSRQKIRTRRYEDGGDTFLEVKNKSNRGRTHKRRIAIDGSAFDAIHDHCSTLEFLAEHSRYDVATLAPALATRFVRITIVNRNLSERVTIDLNLCYEDLRSGRSATICGMAIVEVKQEGSSSSEIKAILRDMRVMPFRVSKYCLGTALTVEGIKKNRLQLKLRDIEKRIGYGRVHISAAQQIEK